MKTTRRKQYIVSALFSCGTLFLTTGIVAAVQQNKPVAENNQPDQKSLSAPSITITGGSIEYNPNQTTKPDKENILGPYITETWQKDIDYALAWLTLFDHSQYTECYRQLASSTQSAYPQNDWTEWQSAVRNGIGKVVNRQYTSMNYEMGIHKTLRFDTLYTNNQHIIETVILLKQNDGSWKIAQYDLEKKSK